MILAPAAICERFLTENNISRSEVHLCYKNTTLIIGMSNFTEGLRIYRFIIIIRDGNVLHEELRVREIMNLSNDFGSQFVRIDFIQRIIKDVIIHFLLSFLSHLQYS